MIGKGATTSLVGGAKPGVKLEETDSPAAKDSYDEDDETGKTM